MDNGLIPQIGERSALIGESEGIFLFPSKEDMNTALEQWLLEEFDEDEPLIVLKVFLPENFPLEESVEYEKISRQKIDSQYIYFFSEI